MSTVQCVLVASADAGTSPQMVRFTASLSVESIVEVEGVVSLPEQVPPFPPLQYIFVGICHHQEPHQKKREPR